MWKYVETDELYHHGVIGQKWGIRRYQNRDGSLTPAGKRRADKLLREYSKVTGKKIVVKKKTIKTDNQKKTVKDMTNEELDNAIRRKEKENRYRQLYPEKVSAGKRFTNNVKDVLVYGIKEGAKDGAKNIVSTVVKNMGDGVVKYSANKNKK